MSPESIGGDAAQRYAAQGQVWKPRLKVFIGTDGVAAPETPASTEVPTAVTAKVQNTTWHHSDRFQVTFALFKDPDFGYSFWSGLDDISVRVQIAFESADPATPSVPFTDVYNGFADKIVIDPCKAIVTVTGRDPLGILIDLHDIRADVNTNIHTIIDKILTDAKMPPAIYKDVPNPTFGVEYPTDGDKTSHSVGDQSQLNPASQIHAILDHLGAKLSWDNTVSPAQAIIWIRPDGDAYDVIAPQPIYEGTPPGGTLSRELPSNALQLTVSHNLMFSKAFHVMLSTTKLPTGESLTVAWPPTDLETTGSPRYHHIAGANISAEDNQTRAQNYFEMFMLHEWEVEWTCAGPQIINMTPLNILNVSGMGDPIDGPFAIDSIEHSIDWQGGYKGIVHALWGKSAGAANP